MQPFRSALELAEAIKVKAISPVEVAKHYLKEVDRLDSSLNAFVWRRDEDLLKEAKVAEAAVMSGKETPAFFGVPIPIKDLTETAGQPVTQGSLGSKDRLGLYDATVVSLLRQAGFLFMGRTNSPEFGTLPVTENIRHGATRNPWQRDRTPGGSSGGAAAAVAAGMAPIAHASDGGGSIRIPASCCGLVGLKPSRGRVPKGPFASEIMHGFTTDGVLTKTVADTAAALDVLARHDPTAWTSAMPPEGSYLESLKLRPRGKLRIGMTTKGPIDAPVEASSVEAVTKAATILTELGHPVEEVQMQWPLASEQLARDFISIWCTATAYYLDFPDWTLVEPLNVNLRAMAKKQSSYDYVQAVLRLQIFSRKLATNWGKDFDVLLTPTLAMEPPPIGWMFATGETDPEKLLWRATEMVPYVGWCNVTGQPAISLPMHVSDSGLPVGVQFVGPPWREDILLSLAQELEDATCWPETLPVS